MFQFFDYANGPDGAALHTLAITGVGSSAYGAVAFAWDVSTALGEPVAAVVPGYGLADVVPQALGGWFGFEAYDALQTLTQSFLARFAPSLALIGKDLARTTPGHAHASTGAPVFRHGSASSDDVHAILQQAHHARDRSQQGGACDRECFALAPGAWLVKPPRLLICRSLRLRISRTLELTFDAKGLFR